MIIWYKNSFLASIVSICGSVIAIGALATIFTEDVAGGIMLLVVGIAMVIWGKSISNNKAFKKWWKQIEEHNLESAVAQDLNTAVAIYRKNPQKRTIKKIATLNPTFAQYITENIVNKK